MAKSMTTKANTTVSIESVAENKEDKVIETKVEKPIEVKEVKKEPRKFMPDDMILCRCVRPNPVIFYSSKTDTRYEFGGYGDTNELYYSDLLKLKTSKSPVLYQPKILIEDEELREQWNKDLKEVENEYIGIYYTEDLFDKKPDEFEKYLRNASDSIKNLVLLSASTMLREDKLTDVRIIRILDDVLGTQFKEFI